MQRCTRGLSVGLAATILTLSLSSCGQAVMAPVSTSTPVLALSATTPQALAARFVADFGSDPQFKATAQGARVIVQGPEGIRLVYDFSHTPETGKVQLQAGTTTTEIDYAPEAGVKVAWMVVKIAIRMVYGGVKGYFKYVHAHPGAIDKQDLAKAIIYGMLEQGVASLPFGFMWKRLFPIVWKWIFKDLPYQRMSVKELYELWAKDLPQIEAILREALTQQAN